MLIFAGSCKKDKPLAGRYYGILNYDAPQGVVRTAEIEITESNKDVIIINGSELNKDGKKIEGHIANLSFSSHGIWIVGEWSHKLCSKTYLINGTFTEYYSQGGNDYQNTGTFEIKSN